MMFMLILNCPSLFDTADLRERAQNFRHFRMFKVIAQTNLQLDVHRLLMMFVRDTGMFTKSPSIAY
jgi:hypothetical protein